MKDNEVCMKGKVVKIILITLLVVVLSVLLFSAIWPLFQKKAKTEDLSFPFTSINNEENKERIVCVDDNLDALLWRLKVINTATETLDFATFSFNDDRSGRDIMAALNNAANRGVKIRMVIDGLSTFLYLRNSDYFNVLASNENVTVKHYNPINFLKPWRFNYRMHDKYIIADDDVYMLGGRNTKNLSIGNYQEEKDIDRDVVVYNQSPHSNDSLHQVKNYFNNIWNENCTKVYKAKGRNKKITEDSIAHLKMYYENLKEDFPSCFEPIDWINETMAVNSIYLLSNPIHNGNKKPLLWANLNQIIRSGKDIIIQTPYIMCNKMMYGDLRALNDPLKDGSKRNVRIVTNSVENGANIMGCADYLNQKKKIRGLGHAVYEYNGDHSSHAKTVLIDDNISVIGSFNYDMRSAYIDTELMLVIDSPELNKYLRDINIDNMKQSRCVKSDGSVTYGENYVEKSLSKGKKVLYTFLRVLTVPLRFLL